MNVVLTTDFSYGANKAIQYIIQLFGTEHVEYDLLNALEIKRAGATFSRDFISDVDDYHEDALNELKASLIKKNPGLVINSSALPGSLVAVIDRFTQLKKIDVISLGANGSSNIYEEVLGSSAKEIIEYSKIPVLVVPVVTPIKNPKNILIGIDSNIAKTKDSLLKFIQNINLNDVKITLINIQLKNQLPAELMEALKYDLQNIDQSLQIDIIEKASNEASIDNQILEFAEQNDMDLIITSPHNHSLFQRLFMKSTTKNLVEKTHLPLLALKG